MNIVDENIIQTHFSPRSLVFGRLRFLTIKPSLSFKMLLDNLKFSATGASVTATSTMSFIPLSGKGASLQAVRCKGVADWLALIVLLSNGIQRQKL